MRDLFLTKLYRNMIIVGALLGAIAVLGLVARPAHAQSPNTFTMRGWYNYPPTCIIKGVKQFYTLQVQNISDHSVTAKVTPRGFVGAATLATLAGASPSLRGEPPYYMHWKITLRPGQTSRVFKISYVFPTNVFGARDHGGVFNVAIEIMDTSQIDGATEVITHANECLK